MYTSCRVCVRQSTQQRSTHPSARKDDLAGHEDQQDDSRLDHAVDETREELRASICAGAWTHLGLIRAEVAVSVGETFEPDGELDIDAADDVLRASGQPMVERRTWILKSWNLASKPSF